MDRPARAEARVIAGPEGALIVTFAFEYLQGIGVDGFRVIAALGAPKPDRATKALFQVWYMTMPPKEIRASPLVTAEKASSRQKASRSWWWWAGARVAIPHLDPDAPDSVKGAWILSLPKVSEDRYWWLQGSINGYIITSVPLKP